MSIAKEMAKRFEDIEELDTLILELLETRDAYWKIYLAEPDGAVSDYTQERSHAASAQIERLIKMRKELGG